MLGKLTDEVVNTAKLETPEVAEKILGAKDGNKPVLVEKLGGFLTSDDKTKRDGTTDQTTKIFLGEKGLQGPRGPSGQDNASATLKNDKTFQKAVAAKML